VPALMYSTVQFRDFIPLFQRKTPVCEIDVPMVVPVKITVYWDVMMKCGRWVELFRHLQCVTVEQKMVDFWVPAPCRG